MENLKQPFGTTAILMNVFITLLGTIIIFIPIKLIGYWLETWDLPWDIIASFGSLAISYFTSRILFNFILMMIIATRVYSSKDPDPNNVKYILIDPFERLFIRGVVIIISIYVFFSLWGTERENFWDSIPILFAAIFLLVFFMKIRNFTSEKFLKNRIKKPYEIMG